MALACAVDERQRRGIMRGEFATVIWPSRGQEAIAAGVSLALQPDERLGWWPGTAWCLRRSGA
jgi:pyruvate dehydrogenase E1 component alpha subunit